MKLSIRSDIDLDNGPAHSYVTWLDVCIGDGEADLRGVARVALVHVGEMADACGDIQSVLHGTSLDALGRAYFADGWYKDEFADGAGIDILYIERVEIVAELRDRNVDLAMVRRLCDTIGSGCQLAVMPYVDAHATSHWGRLGFCLSTPGRSAGLMHMKLGHRHARVVDSTGTGDFEILPTTIVHDAPARHTHN